MNEYNTVIGKRIISPSAFILRFERKELKFIPGQYLSVRLAGSKQARDYSIYSTPNDPYIEILVKVIETGIVSKELSKCTTGDLLKITGPKGDFKLIENQSSSQKHVFIATGTGISPFHSIIKSNPTIDFLLIHGVRFGSEAYDKEEYNPEQYILCTSRDNTGKFKGHTTEYLKSIHLNLNNQFYLCGNSDMIFEAFEIITQKGIAVNNIHSEIYF